MKKVKETKNKKGFLVALGDFITNHRYFFLVLFLGMTVFGVFNINKVGINNSIISYLPDDTETKRYGCYGAYPPGKLRSHHYSFCQRFRE